MPSCRNREQIDKIVNLYVEKWLTRDNMKEFGQYFFKLWINSHWNKWQLFHQACGLSITKSPIETITMSERNSNELDG